MHKFKVIWYKVPELCIGGPFAVALVRADGMRTGTTCTGIRSEEAARQRASDYAWSYGSNGAQCPIERVYHGGEARTQITRASHAAHGDYVLSVGAL